MIAFMKWFWCCHLFNWMFGNNQCNISCDMLSLTTNKKQLVSPLSTVYSAGHFDRRVYMEGRISYIFSNFWMEALIPWIVICTVGQIIFIFVPAQVNELFGAFFRRSCIPIFEQKSKQIQHFGKWEFREIQPQSFAVQGSI